MLTTDLIAHLLGTWTALQAVTSEFKSIKELTLQVLKRMKEAGFYIVFDDSENQSNLTRPASRPGMTDATDST